MKTDLTKEQVNGYRENGFLIARNFLNSQELLELKNAVTTAVKILGNQKVGGIENENDQKRDDYYENVFLQKLNLWKINPVIKKYFSHPELGKMLCQLEGIDGIRIWHDQTLQKEPWGNPTSFHLDNPYWSFTSFNAISIWIALDDATLQNGCLYFILGSHLRTSHDKFPAIGMNMNSVFDDYPDLGDIPAVAAEMKAGDASFHNGLTIHGAGANMNPGYRRAMTCAYMPEGSTFNGKKNILSKAQFERMRQGELMNDESQNPLVWSKELEPVGI